MGWTAYIIGELAFPAGAIERWRNLPAELARIKWPRMIAQGLILAHEDEDEDDASVDDTLRLSDKLNHYFGSIDVTDNAVGIAFHVDSSNYWMVCEPVVRVTSAAAVAGATGRVRFLDPGDAIAQATFNGAVVTIGNGRLVANERKNEPLAADDVAHMRASVQNAIESYKTNNAHAEPTPKAKPKPS